MSSQKLLLLPLLLQSPHNCCIYATSSVCCLCCYKLQREVPRSVDGGAPASDLQRSSRKDNLS